MQSRHIFINFSFPCNISAYQSIYYYSNTMSLNRCSISISCYMHHMKLRLKQITCITKNCAKAKRKKKLKSSCIQYWKTENGTNSNRWRKMFFNIIKGHLIFCIIVQAVSSVYYTLVSLSQWIAHERFPCSVML